MYVADSTACSRLVSNSYWSLLQVVQLLCEGGERGDREGRRDGRDGARVALQPTVDVHKVHVKQDTTTKTLNKINTN